MDISGKTWKTIILVLVVVIVIALLIWWLVSRGNSGSSGSGDSLKSDSFGQSGNSLKSSTDTTNTGNARASGNGATSLFSWARKMMGGDSPPEQTQVASNTPQENSPTTHQQ